MKKEKYFFFSECQRRARINTRKFDNYCELKEDGQIVYYTECGDFPMPAGVWVDYEHLGIGVYHHSEANPDWMSSIDLLDLFLRGL